MSVEFTVKLGLDLDDISDKISAECNYEEIIEFIEDLDRSVSDVEFTKELIKLADKFKKEIEEEETNDNDDIKVS